MNSYRDYILNSYLEDMDYDNYDSYDEEYDEYDEYDEEELDQAYMEGYLYALQEKHGNGGDVQDAVFARRYGGPAVDKTDDEYARVAKTAKEPTRKGPQTEAQYQMRTRDIQDTLKKEREAGVYNGPTGKKGMSTGKKAAIATGAVATAGAITAAGVVGKEYKAYKAAGGKLSFKEWIKAGKPKPKATEKAIAAVKAKVMKEAVEEIYNEAYDEAYNDICNELYN